MSTPTELPGLLRGCVKWRDGRAWADNDALLIVADWCEEEGRLLEAHTVRQMLEADCDEYTFNPDGSRFGKMNVPGGGRFEYDVRSQEGRWTRQSQPYGAAVVRCAGGECEYEVLADEYERLPDRVTPRGRTARGLVGPTRAGLARVRDLARRHCIAHMLGWPPLRLLGEE